ncbi:histamine H2 receptor-like [Stylophora pistillata]|uniref:histamine H2 receptor-like n=1 Tax=Stylophora pistillata TaxID=50429 RepID=UPI000C03A14C|nr:histamine H2 receptor-like [Stylophora pistillata]
MAESNCDILLRIYPQISELDDFQSSFIINCVLNSFICYTAIVLNIFTIYAIAKTSALSKPLKTLLVSVAVSDVGVGLIVEPLFLSLLIKWLQLQNEDCTFFLGLHVVLNLFSMTSFLNIMAISIDRFLAIQFHLRYQSIVTHKRVVGVVIFIWAYSLSASFSLFLFPFAVLSTVGSPIGTICLLVTAAIYCRIYFITRRHKRQIQIQRVQEQEERSRQNSEMRNLARTMKTAVGVLYVYFAFLVCYAPLFIYLAARAIYGSGIVKTSFQVSTYTLMFFNSTLNPVIYCWRMRHIRRAMVDTLRKLYTNLVS